MIHEQLSGKTRAARYRAAMRARGYRIKQMWVPDVRSSAFRAQIAQEVAAIDASAGAAEDQAFVDAVSDWDDLPPYDVSFKPAAAER